MSMRILLAEDDKNLGSLISRDLHKAGNVVDWVQDGESALAALINTKDTFDIVILDLGLPKKNGLLVLQEARNKGLATPVMILTARDTIEDRVKGLDSGSDDYLVKPFDLHELNARLRALVRRSKSRPANGLDYKNIHMEPVSHMVTIDNEPINLPRREFAILQTLIENVGRVVTRESLLHKLYGWNEEVDSNTIEVHIYNLRKKLGEGTKLGRNYISTIRGVGYMIPKDMSLPAA